MNSEKNNIFNKMDNHDSQSFFNQTFENIDMSDGDTTVIDCVFSDCIFSGCILSGNFASSRFNNCYFYNCKFIKANFDYSIFENARFGLSTFFRTSLVEAKFIECTFSTSYFNEISMSKEITFQNCKGQSFDAALPEIPKKIDDLKTFFEQCKLPESIYTLGELGGGEIYGMEENQETQKFVIYFSERGSKSQIKVFENESEAIQKFVELVFKTYFEYNI